MNKALLVIDLQNDFIGDKRNKKFTYSNIEQLVGNVNQQITKFNSEGAQIIYVAQIIPNVWWGRKFFGFTLKGSEGAQIFKDIQIVSKNYFEKMVSDAFSNKELRKFIKENQISHVSICGIDEAGCVSATAKGALKLGLKVDMLMTCIDSMYPSERLEKLISDLKAKDVNYI